MPIHHIDHEYLSIMRFDNGLLEVFVLDSLGSGREEATSRVLADSNPQHIVVALWQYVPFLSTK